MASFHLPPVRAMTVRAGVHLQAPPFRAEKLTYSTLLVESNLAVLLDHRRIESRLSNHFVVRLLLIIRTGPRYQQFPSGYRDAKESRPKTENSVNPKEGGGNPQWENSRKHCERGNEYRVRKDKKSNAKCVESLAVPVTLRIRTGSKRVIVFCHPRNNRQNPLH